MSRPLRGLFFVLLLALGGCPCRPAPVDPIELGFRVQPSSLDFGRVLEGDKKTLGLFLSAETRAAVTIEVSVEGRFSSASQVELAGGGQSGLDVTFNAGNGEALGVLRLQVGDRFAEVQLSGFGVRPPTCLPTRECVSSVYVLEEDRCVESPLPDESACDPASLCLEQGRCRAGECLGVPRSCDDGNPCTDDACSMETGCVYTAHQCPAPAEACRVAVCEPETGCGAAPAANSTPCGPLNCETYSICNEGECITGPTPDGVPCAAPIACLPEATCQDHVCVRETRADWPMDWRAPLASAPRGELASIGSNLFLSWCAPEAPPPEVPDAGASPDGGEDAGGGDDADAGDVDAGDAPDAGEAMDAGEVMDAGACVLTSFTGTGFERFTLVYEDGEPREVVAASGAGVLLRVDGGLELRSPSGGGLQQRLPEGSWALSATHVYLTADGGLHELDSDGGARLLAAASGELVRGDALYAWSADAGSLVRVLMLEDGGVDRRELTLTGIDSDVLLTAEGRAVLPAWGMVQFEDDGGVSLTPFDAGTALLAQTIVGRGVVHFFDQRCDGGTCEVWVRGVDDFDAGVPWFEGFVTDGALLTSTLVDPVSGVFGALTKEDAGTDFRLFVEGEMVAICRLPPGSRDVQRAHFTASAMVVTVQREDGGLALESYGLNGLPVSTFGWTTPRGVGGTRSDRQ